MSKIISVNIKVIALIIAILTSEFIYAYSIPSIGKPELINFSRSQYMAGTQNWGISQQKDGLMYIANNDGLLEYGLDHWMITPFTEGKKIRVVKCSDTGEIFVGSQGEFGFFTRNIIGKLEYTSLIPTIDSKIDIWDEIWRIHLTDDGVLFESTKHIFHYSNGKTTTLFSQPNIEFSAYIDNRLFVQIKNVGLGSIHNNKFELLDNGDKFSGTTVRGIFCAGRNKFIICTLHDGIFTYENGTIQPLNNNLNREFKQHQIYYACEYMNSYLALGTVSNGLYVIDKNGKLIQTINRHAGLQNNTVLSICTDSYNNLWLGLDNGLSMLKLYSLISVIDSPERIGTGYVSAINNGKLYLGTNQGLYVTDWDASKGINPYEIKIIDNTGGQVWNLQVINNKLYCSHHRGTFMIDNQKAILISDYVGGWQIEHLKDEYYIQTTYYKLIIYRQIGGQLKVHREIALTDKINNRFAVDPYGSIWCVNEQNHILRLKIDPSSGKVTEKQSYRINESGYPGVSLIQGEIYVTCNSGIFTYSSKEDHFISNSKFNSYFPKERIANIIEDQYNRIWFISSLGVGYVINKHGKDVVVRKPFASLKKRMTWSYNEINIVDQEMVMLGVTEGFAIANMSVNVEQNYNHSVAIRDVKYSHVESAIFDSLIRVPVPKLPFDYNDLIFKFSSNFFDIDNDMLYRTRLIGDNSVWTEWTNSAIKEYTNITEGAYQFEVQAKNKYGIESAIITFKFEIRPPIYRSIIAKIIYVLLFVWLSAFAYIKTRNRVINKMRNIQQKHKMLAMANEMEIIQLRNNSLESDLTHRNQELTNSTYNIIQNNEILNRIKRELKTLYDEFDLDIRNKKVSNIIAFIDNSINSKKSWKVFEDNFNRVHENFFKRLKSSYPSLNQNDLRLCAYICLNKSSKEIASLMNISIRGVESGRYRLRKKLNIDRDDKIYDVIISELPIDERKIE